MGCITGQVQEDKEVKKINPVLEPPKELNQTNALSITTVSDRKRPYQLRIKEINESATQSLRKQLIVQYINDYISKPTARKYVLEFEWTEKLTIFLKTTAMSSIRRTNNRQLLNKDGILKPKLQFGKHYQTVNQFIMAMLKDCFQIDVVIPYQNPLSLTAFGMSNNKYLCYLNSGIQLLISIPQFVEAYRQVVNKELVFSHATKQLFKKFRQSKSQVKTSEEFSKFLKKRFKESEQHDCQQFLRFYLSKLQEEELKKPCTSFNAQNDQSALKIFIEHNNSVIDRLFSVLTVSLITCVVCRKAKRIYESQMQLGLALTTDNSLASLLKQYQQQQILQDKYECQNCKKSAKGSSLKIKLVSLPPWLFITIKRYKNNGKKTFNYLTFQHQINFLVGQKRYNYELQGVVIHAGTASHFGHYYGIFKRGRQWYKLNDERVDEVSPLEVQREQPYILLFKNKN